MGQVQIASEVAGSVIEIVAPVGSRVERDDVLVLIESMKMEIPIAASQSGTVLGYLVATGDVVEEGDALATLKTDA